MRIFLRFVWNAQNVFNSPFSIITAPQVIMNNNITLPFFSFSHKLEEDEKCFLAFTPNNTSFQLSQLMQLTEIAIFAFCVKSDWPFFHWNKECAWEERVNFHDTEMSLVLCGRKGQKTERKCKNLTNGEVNISHEETTMVLWIYDGV